jgi:hypothetical protein
VKRLHQFTDRRALKCDYVASVHYLAVKNAGFFIELSNTLISLRTSSLSSFVFDAVPRKAAAWKLPHFDQALSSAVTVKKLRVW